MLSGLGIMENLAYVLIDNNTLNCFSIYGKNPHDT